MADFFTYRKLLEAISSLTEDQLDMTVSTYCPETNEVVPVGEAFVASELPEKHYDEVDVEDDQPLLVLGHLND